MAEVSPAVSPQHPPAGAASPRLARVSADEALEALDSHRGGLTAAAAMYLPGISDVLAVQPISLADWLMVAGLALSLLVVMEIRKAWLRASRR